MTKRHSTLPPREDWQGRRDRIGLAAVATAHLGPAPGRRGEGGRRLWWPCPFHDDRNPSLCVEPGRPHWKCFGCGARGDAATLVMRLRGCSFPEALALLDGSPGAAAPGAPPASASGAPRRPSPGAAGAAAAGAPGAAAGAPGAAAGAAAAGASGAAAGAPEGMPPAAAAALVEEAAARLWTPAGARALAWLRRRGLRDESIRAARLGFAPRVGATTRDGRPYAASGIVVPWLDGDGVPTLVKVRQPAGRRPKYCEVHRDPARHVGLYPGPEAVRPGRPLIVAEGELDALLLSQELGDLAAVATLGSASARPDATVLTAVLAAWPWLVATDADAAGDRAAAAWPAPARRVRPPAPFRDWTEAAVGPAGTRGAGVDLRRWFGEVLAGVDPAPYAAADLDAWRWGPARDDPTPGLAVRHADPAAIRAALEAAARDVDPDTEAERLAIRAEPTLDSAASGR